MIERVTSAYDVMKVAHGTRKEIEANKDLLLPYEIAFANDTNELLVKDEQGNLTGQLGKLGVVDTVADLVNYGGSVGSVVQLLGYYEKGDGAGHKRIGSLTDDGSGIQDKNGIWWNIIHSGDVNVSWFGAKGDKVTDDTVVIQKAINYGKFEKLVQSGESLITSQIILLQGKVYYFNKLLVDTRINTSESAVALKNSVMFTTVEMLSVSTVYCNGYDMHDFRGTEENKITVPAFYGYYNRRTTFDNVEILGFRNKPFSLKEGYETFVKKIRVQSDNVDTTTQVVNKNILFPDTEYTIGVYFDCLDSGVSDCVSIGYNIGAVFKGGNFITNFHPWGYINKMIIGALNIGSRNLYSNCYIDTVSMLEGFPVGAFYDLKKRNCTVTPYPEIIGNDYVNVFQIGGNTPMFAFGDSDNSYNVGRWNKVSNSISHDISNPAWYELEGSAVGSVSNLDGYGHNVTPRMIFDNVDSLVGDLDIYETFNIIFKKYIYPSTPVELVIVNKFPKLLQKFDSFFWGNFNFNAENRMILKVNSFGYVTCEIECLNIGEAGTKIIFSTYWNGKVIPKDESNTKVRIIKSQKKTNTIQQLDTPYYATKMQQEGVYQDFITYMDEKHEYDKQMQTQEDTGVMNLNVLQEPVPSDKLVEFKEKYLG